MLESLFSSRVRAKVLASFFLQPGKNQNAWELAQSLNENYSAVWKELAHLERLGILTSVRNGNSKDYMEDKSCPIAPELRSIVLKTEGAGMVIKRRLKDMESIKEAFIYGSYASGDADAASDLDLMIIGDINLEQLATDINQIEKELNRLINYVIYSEKEWDEKAAVGDPFWENVTKAPKLILLGGEYAV